VAPGLADQSDPSCRSHLSSLAHVGTVMA
jgi:hypothetical protein